VVGQTARNTHPPFETYARRKMSAAASPRSPASVASSVTQKLCRDLRDLRHDCKYTEWAFRQEARTAFDTSFKDHPRMMAALHVGRRVEELPSLRTYLQCVNILAAVLSSPVVLIPVWLLSCWWFGVWTFVNGGLIVLTTAVARVSAATCRGVNLLLQAERAQAWATRWCQMLAAADEVRTQLYDQHHGDGVQRQTMTARVGTLQRDKHALKLTSPPTNPDAWTIARKDLNETWEKDDVSRDQQDFAME
jgi:hypothetical protein